MSKKNKNLVAGCPEVCCMDSLGYASDEHLYDYANHLESERNHMLSSNRDVYLWEVELAYIRREQGIRRLRPTFHAEYLRKLSPALLADVVTSDSLPNLN